MNSTILASMTPEDRVLVDVLKEFSKHNGLTEFSDDFIPPKYTIPNYIAPESGQSLFITSIVLVAVTCIVVATRYYARVFIAGGLGADDFAIGIATIFLVGSATTYSYAVKAIGFGRHIYDMDLGHIETLLQITYAMPILYNIGVFFIKLSVLLFYRRLFGLDRTLQRLVKLFMLFEVLYTVGYCIGLVFICQPIHAWWNITLRPENCPGLSKTMIIYVSLRSVSVFTDVLVLCLPMKMLWELKIPMRQKVGLGLIFGLGIMACLTAVLRLSFLPRLLLNLDVSWNVIPVSMLDELEQSLGIITASLPALTAIIAKFRGSIDVRASKYQSTASFELSNSGNLEANSQKGIGRDTPGPDFDFLSLAYDPDGVNTVFTRAWASGPRPKERGGLGRMIDRVGLGGKPPNSSPSDENLVGVQVEPHGISKTTTVEVSIDKRVRL